jgi:xylose dehydrogenase (NAD/NADP)
VSRDNLRWGLLSTAAINDAIVHAVSQAPRSEVAAVASRDLAHARRYASNKNIKTAYGSYEELLEDNSIDVVYVSVPNTLHAEWTIKAAQHGKHAMCEKPIVTRLEDLDAINAAAADNRVTVFEAFMHLHHPQTLRAKELIASGELGQITHMSSWFGYYLPPEDNENIRLNPRLGGGSLWDVGVYPVSLLLDLAQLGLPLSVTAIQAEGETGVDVEFAGLMRFRSDAVAHVSCGFRTPFRQGAVIAGPRGMLRLAEPWIPGMKSRVERGANSRIDLTSFDGDERAIVVESSNPWQAEVEAMEACVLDGARPVVPLSKSREVLQTVLALRRSAESGRPVAVEEELTA